MTREHIDPERFRRPDRGPTQEEVDEARARGQAPFPPDLENKEEGKS